MLPLVETPLRLGEVPGAEESGAIMPTYSYHDVARMLKVSEVTVKRWVKLGQIPSPVYFGSTARFLQEQMKEIAKGPSLRLTHERKPSPRAERASAAFHGKGKKKSSAGVVTPKSKKPSTKPKGARGNGLKRSKK